MARSRMTASVAYFLSENSTTRETRDLDYSQALGGTMAGSTQEVCTTQQTGLTTQQTVAATGNTETQVCTSAESKGMARSRTTQLHWMQYRQTLHHQ